MRTRLFIARSIGVGILAESISLRRIKEGCWLQFFWEALSTWLGKWMRCSQWKLAFLLYECLHCRDAMWRCEQPITLAYVFRRREGAAAGILVWLQPIAPFNPDGHMACDSIEIHRLVDSHLDRDKRPVGRKRIQHDDMNDRESFSLRRKAPTFAG